MCVNADNFPSNVEIYLEQLIEYCDDNYWASKMLYSNFDLFHFDLDVVPYFKWSICR